MNQSEKKAEKILYQKGWNPKKIESHKIRGYLPDFVCKHKKYVEVKKINSTYNIQINENQLKNWFDLINNGKKVFLMIFNNYDEFLYMFKIRR